MSDKQPIFRPLYATAVQEAVASGDLHAMKTTAAEVQKHLDDHGNVSAALEALKIEIARLEAGSK